MSNIDYHPSVDIQEHDRTAPRTKRVSAYGWDSVNLLKTRIATNPNGKLETICNTPLIPDNYDYIGVQYPDLVTEIFIFRLGGVSGTIISTITITYTDSTKNNLLSVAKT